MAFVPRRGWAQGMVAKTHAVSDQAPMIRQSSLALVKAIRLELASTITHQCDAATRNPSQNGRHGG
jgi:hypothetical protein